MQEKEEGKVEKRHGGKLEMKEREREGERGEVWRGRGIKM